MNRQCQGSFRWPGKPLMRCPDDAVGQAEGMCVHEHLRGPMWLCEMHQTGWPRGLLCLQCYETDGHECLVELRVMA